MISYTTLLTDIILITNKGQISQKDYFKIKLMTDSCLLSNNQCNNIQ